MYISPFGLLSYSPMITLV